MSAPIWNGWELWEKLCFILACAIVLVIIGGCIKLAYNHHRIRKYTRIAAEKAQIREQLERTASFTRGRAKEIPFGVRALESGIEVEGVWISGTNTPASTTPAHSIPGSPTLGATTDDSKFTTPEKVASDRASLPSQITRIDIPQPVYGHDDPRYGIQMGGMSRQTYQPRRSSGLRFSDSNEMYPEAMGDQAAALAALEGRSIGFGPAAEVHEAHRRSKSWATTSWTETHHPVSESSQAASNRALLHPRHDPSIRLAGFPSNKGNTQPDYEDDRDEDTVVEEMRQPSAVYGPHYGRSPLSFEDLPDERTYQNPSPYAIDYRLPTPTEEYFPSMVKAKDEATTPTPTMEDIRSPEIAATSQGQSRNISDSSYQNVALDKTLVRYPHETIEQPRRSQVIRKINSGFEILRPGTFGQPPKDVETLSELKGGAGEQGKQRHSKRLYRKRGATNLGKS